MVGIWASRLGSESEEGDQEKKEKQEEKISDVCESIGHRPFWGRCPQMR